MIAVQLVSVFACWLYLIDASKISSQKIVTLLHLVALFSFTFDNRNASKEGEETAEPSQRAQPQEATKTTNF